MKLFTRKSNSTLEHNLYVNNVNGILQAIAVNLVAPFAMLYAKRLHATDNEIALLNSYPAMFCIIAVFVGTYLLRKHKDKQKLVAIFFGLARSFFLVFVLVPFLPKSYQAGAFVLLYGMMNFPNSIAVMGWQSYIADLFSAKWRGRAFSRRSSIGILAAMAVTFITGNLLFYIPKNDMQRINLYQLFFIIAFLIGIVEIYSFTKHRPDKSNKQIEIVTEFTEKSLISKSKDIYHMVTSNRVFLDYSICVILLSFAWQMAWPLFFSYEFDVLHSNEAWTSLSTAVSFISQAFAFTLWQKLAEKKGNNYVLALAALALALCPFIYLMAKSMVYIIIFTTITGSAGAGVVLLLSNTLYESTPNENRTVYIAVYTVLTNITLMIAPIVGMAIKSYTNIYIALLVSGILRILASIALYFRYRKYKKLGT